ncbi:hypothetical protein [Fulvitalea axinellae]|uniref:hypothetical protein n=1 Tax=Fulvitalea axinellae TaxID=1182444 RepID=UPI0030CA26B0
MKYLFLKVPLVFTLLLLCSLSCLQAQKILDGEYLVSGGKVQKCTILNRQNGTIKASLKVYQQGNVDLVFTPIKERSGAYELYDKRTNFVLVNEGGVISLLELDKMNRVKEKAALGKDKKSLKEAKKKLGIKSSFAKELGGFSKQKEAKTVEAPEYFVKRPTSDFHKKHVGEIVFFSSEPTVGKEAPSNIKKDFKVGEPIWAVAYLPAPLKQNKYLKRLTNSFYDAYGNWNYWITIGVDKSDKDMSLKENEIANQCTVKTLQESDLDKNYVVFQVMPSSASDLKMDKGGAKFLMGRMGERLGSYKHRMRISLTDGDMKQDEELIFGYFNFDVSAGADQLKQMSKKLEEEILKSHKLPTAVKKDGAIEAEMLSQIKLWAQNKRKWSNVRFKRVIITMDWQILKDDYGNIEGKYIEGNVLYSSDEGCAHRNFGFIRKYLGGGNYASSLRQHTTGAIKPLSCDKVQ